MVSSVGTKRKGEETARYPLYFHFPPKWGVFGRKAELESLACEVAMTPVFYGRPILSSWQNACRQLSEFIVVY